jgi:hypothetical protein
MSNPLFILFAIALLGLPGTLTEYALIPGKYCDFALDQQGNVIMANAEGIISKKDPAGRTLATQAYSNHGGNPQIDASNGLQVLVYFPSTRHLLMLDNQLNQRRLVDFNTLENYQIRGFGLAADGNYWILDGRDGFLKKLDYEGRTLASTMLAGAWLPGGKTRIYDDGQYLFLAAENDEIIRVLNATLNRLRLVNKPAGYWDARDGSLCYTIDTQRLVREGISLGSRRDTLNINGTNLQRFRVSGSILANSSDRGLHLYR